MAKIAAVFPGIGYHTDKPLLYYSKKIALKQGYEIVNLTYTDLPHGIKGNAEKMREAGLLALKQVKEQLDPLNLASCEDVLFLSKSIGTAVAQAYAKGRGIAARQVLYTPVEQTFEFVEENPAGIAFCGTKDQWADPKKVMAKCREKGLPLYVTEGANHSLETEDPLQDIKNLDVIMQHTYHYIAENRRDPSDI